MCAGVKWLAEHTRVTMSTQSYYKDLLGFDPREVYESSGGSNGGASQSTTIKSGSRTSRIVQHHHYSSHSGNNSPQQQQQHSNGVYHGSPSKKLKHSEYVSSSTIRSSHSASPGAQIGASILAANNQGDGYEDALTQFKGTMSIWEYFVENWDITGMSQTNIKSHRVVLF